MLHNPTKQNYLQGSSLLNTFEILHFRPKFQISIFYYTYSGVNCNFFPVITRTEKRADRHPQKLPCKKRPAVAKEVKASDVLRQATRDPVVESTVVPKRCRDVNDGRKTLILSISISTSLHHQLSGLEHPAIFLKKGGLFLSLLKGFYPP